ncbi:MAG TPA: hypothetical protein VH413_18935 [Verrucomicrobiae bacterium]|nr:hypothetical protein [Verrucomicrobiae bacterium]
MNVTRTIGKIFNAASALLLTALILFLSAAAVSPDLHKLVHADACAANHTCAITLFSKAQVSSPPIPVVCECFIAPMVMNLPLEKFVAHAVFDVQLAPGRAPPFC